MYIYTYQSKASAPGSLGVTVGSHQSQSPMVAHTHQLNAGPKPRPNLAPTRETCGQINRTWAGALFNCTTRCSQPHRCLCRIAFQLASVPGKKFGFRARRGTPVGFQCGRRACLVLHLRTAINPGLPAAESLTFGGLSENPATKPTNKLKAKEPKGWPGATQKHVDPEKRSPKDDAALILPGREPFLE